LPYSMEKEAFLLGGNQNQRAARKLRFNVSNSMSGNEHHTRKGVCRVLWQGERLGGGRFLLPHGRRRESQSMVLVHLGKRMILKKKKKKKKVSNQYKKGGLGSHRKMNLIQTLAILENLTRKRAMETYVSECFQPTNEEERRIARPARCKVRNKSVKRGNGEKPLPGLQLDSLKERCGQSKTKFTTD